MEDSGIDSDPKSQHNDSLHHMDENTAAEITPTTTATSTINVLKKSSKLHKKLERQRDVARKNNFHVAIEQPSKKTILSRNRLHVPSKGDTVISTSVMQPLVMLSDDSEDEFSVPGLSREAHREITQQLIKDGYNLDLEPDDEDLDLIPPRPLQERCVCCPSSRMFTGLQTTSCSIQ